jgi:FAD/FMN-containing dehydrogenase/NAD(P)-dependent dehydrogenase (short-subunit alcohol dehydrogenase family)
LEAHSSIPFPENTNVIAPTERLPAPRFQRPARLDGKRVVVTGGTAGIGLALASQLAARGAVVVVASRRESSAGCPHRALDLTSLESVRAFAAELNEEAIPIDLLILNAGVHVPWKRIVTGDGHELHWQVNYLANFALSQLLLPLCARSELKRLLYVASEAHRLASLHCGPLLGFWRRYARSKEAAVAYFLRFQEMHPRLTVRAASPGYVDTELHRGKDPVLARIERGWSRPRAPHAAAREMLDIFEKEDESAVYWDRGRPSSPTARCEDAYRADWMWRRSLAATRHLLPGARAPERVSNYGRNVQALVPPIVRPTTVESLAAVVRRAAEQGKQIKVCGARHSYNDSFHSPDCMISLERFDRVVRFDPEQRTITCEAGISIGAVCEYLDDRGFALRYSGNFGKQSLAGALATGTHGYGRDGGVMSELVRATTLLRADGSIVHVANERDLRALRLSLGALGVILELTLAIEPTGPCRYEVACMRREAFNDRLVPLARAHEYLRFVRHPLDARYVLYVTIDRHVEDVVARSAAYISDACATAPELLVPILRQPAARKVLGRALSVHSHRYAIDVPFSSLLFIRSGVVESHPGLAKAGAMALDRNDWLNMELAVPLERFADFERLFAEEMPGLSRLSRRRPYFTSRVVGAASNVVLAPNYDRDVVFCDVHADPREPSAVPFLQRLERAAMVEMGARPHWGKVFYAGHDTLRDLYPTESFAEFAEAKRRFDPQGAFSSAYTRRVVGL